MGIDRLIWEADLPPASATVYAMLPQQIPRLELTTPASAERGKPFKVVAQVLDGDGQPVAGPIPVRITVRDGQGAINEYSDTFAMKNGQLVLEGWITVNDTGGAWSVTAEELASGRSARKYFRVPVRVPTR